MSSEVRQRIEELRQQEQFIRGKTYEIAKDALLVLTADLPLFVDREVKKAFVADPEFAEKMTDEQLRSLRAEISRRGKEKAHEIVTEIDDVELWMRGFQHLEGARSLEDHLELWGKIDQISGTVKAILKDHGFPAAEQGEVEVRYRQPSWFISGRLMTTIAEKYWRKMTEWAEVQREIEELDTQRRREALKLRWDNLA